MTAQAAQPLPVRATGITQPQAGQQAPGGLMGQVNGSRYSPAQMGAALSSGASGGSSSPTSAYGLTNNPNAQAWLTDNGRIGTGVDEFRRFEDQAYSAAMRQMQPQMEAQQRGIEQSLVAKGLQPGSARYNDEMDRMMRGQNDMLQSAAYGAQQQGLAAQNQHFGQEMQNNQYNLAENNQNYGHQFGYDQLANQSAIAAANRGASQASANASIANSRNNAQLAHELGIMQLNEGGRQFDSNNILQSQGQDQNFLLGALGQYNNFMNTGINQFGAQNAANNQWFNENGQLLSNAPGVNFTPTQNFVGNQMQGNQNMVNAQMSQNQMLADMLGGGMMAMACDKRLKKNIKFIETIKGIKYYIFEYINKALGKRVQLGVIAQDLLETHPQAVSVLGKYYVVDLRKLGETA